MELFNSLIQEYSWFFEICLVIWFIVFLLFSFQTLICNLIGDPSFCLGDLFEEIICFIFERIHKDE